MVVIPEHLQDIYEVVGEEVRLKSKVRAQAQTEHPFGVALETGGGKYYDEEGSAAAMEAARTRAMETNVAVAKHLEGQKGKKHGRILGLFGR